MALVIDKHFDAYFETLEFRLEDGTLVSLNGNKAVTTNDIVHIGGHYGSVAAKPVVVKSESEEDYLVF